RQCDDLNTIENIVYVDFDCTNGNLNRRGSIAQQVRPLDPELISESAEGVAGYDLSTYVHTIGHAVHHQAYREQDTKLVASQALVNSETNAEKIERLEKEIQKLKEAA